MVKMTEIMARKSPFCCVLIQVLLTTVYGMPHADISWNHETLVSGTSTPEKTTDKPDRSNKLLLASLVVFGFAIITMLVLSRKKKNNNMPISEPCTCITGRELV
ncbi:hypothetical protein QTP70_018105 [Hemibagrus guttatus]|uniref:Gram-positive cocci surface proteins LPxTG domain-containing protein n=1 Tax=Hemibagrus guttatus TaxID=175788 RepID=A0AAE0QRG9_9TELE|nr:hypothetical protein QTP70_018105 [Hemibagrus guttatus]